jgi:imidazole glycerol phosphate synthase subunit HisF
MPCQAAVTDFVRSGENHTLARSWHLQGFDIELVKSVSAAVTIPVIASSGAGSPEHFAEVTS